MSTRGEAAGTGRELLARLVDDYVDALVHGRPEDLPLSERVRFTENGQHIPLGRGLWGTATADPPPGRAVRVTDPDSGQAAFLGSVSEHGAPVLVASRLRAEGNRITEIESLVVRGHSRFELFDPASMSLPRAHLEQVVDPARRASREQLTGVADRYFDGIERNDGTIIPVRQGCVRFENGVQTVRRASAEDAGFAVGGRLEVGPQISSGMFAYIEQIRDRRYPVIDEERGLVLAIGFFEHPGLLTSVEVAGVGTVPLPRFAAEPSSAMIMELFKVDGGEIVAIEALLDFFPYGMRSGWDD